MNNRSWVLTASLIIIITASVFVLSDSGRQDHDLNKTLVDNRFSVDLPEGQKRPGQTVINDGSQRYYFNQRDVEEAYDCSSREIDGCVPFEPEKTYLECEEMYLPKGNMSDYCETTRDASAVSLKTDNRINHITAPITTEELNVTTHSQLIGENFEFIKPWDLEHISDERFLITGLNGDIYDVKDGNIMSYKLDVLKKGPRNSSQEDPYTGLMGVTLDPDFEENRVIYLHYSYDITYETEKPFVLNKISKFKIDRESGKLEKIETIIENLPGRQYYHGGRMKFGPEDQYLYVTTGSALYQKAQNKSFLGGKVLRMNSDGSVPEDNPFGNEIYAMGFRNPQGLDFSPETGELFTSQHGPWRRDNIAKIGNGTNLGWPQECERSHPDAEIGEEVFCGQTWTLAPSGITFVGDEDHPWYNDLFIAGLRGHQVHRIEFDGGTATGNEIFWFNGFQSEGYPDKGNRIRDVEFRNGRLWVLHDNAFLTTIAPN